MKNLFVLCVAVIVIAGCGPDENLVRDAVLSYTNIVSNIYSSQESAKAEGLVAHQQLELIMNRAKDFASKQVQLYPSLRSIRFAQIDMGANDRANILSNESWDFRYVSLNTGKEIHTGAYDLLTSYSLVKKNGAWHVTEMNVLSKDDDEAFNPFVSLPDEVVPVGIGLTPDELLENTVLAYLKLLADGYAKQDMTALRHSATNRRAMKAYHHMSSMGEGEVRMDPRLLEIGFAEARIVSNNSAIVKTKEDWEYAYFSTKSGEEVYSNTVSYDVTYELLREKGNLWLVDNLMVDQMDQGEGKGALPFFTRPHEKIEESTE